MDRRPNVTKVVSLDDNRNNDINTEKKTNVTKENE